MIDQRFPPELISECSLRSTFKCLSFQDDCEA
jgi:hypothetical protein